MRADELIALLSTIAPDAIVEIYDPESASFAPVSGMGHDCKTGETQLYADVEQDEFAQYLKEGETPIQRLMREIGDSEALARLLAKERARFEFLHSTNSDAAGWEWGVARVRRAADGRIEYLWGLSDHSDIDAAAQLAQSADKAEG